MGPSTQETSTITLKRAPDHQSDRFVVHDNGSFNSLKAVAIELERELKNNYLIRTSDAANNLFERAYRTITELTTHVRSTLDKRTVSSFCIESNNGERWECQFSSCPGVVEGFTISGTTSHMNGYTGQLINVNLQMRRFPEHPEYGITGTLQIDPMESSEQEFFRF